MAASRKPLQIAGYFSLAVYSIDRLLKDASQNNIFILQDLRSAVIPFILTKYS